MVVAVIFVAAAVLGGRPSARAAAYSVVPGTGTLAPVHIINRRREIGSATA